MKKVIINGEYGGIWSSMRDAFDSLGDLYDISCPERLDPEEYRENPMMINWIETVGSNDTALCVVSLPDNVTDYVIEDYDGLEWIIACIDGKIKRFYPTFDN